MATGRTPALPLVPCDSPWLHRRSHGEYNKRGMDFSPLADHNVVQFGPKDDLRCFWKAWSCATCDKITIAWYDFQRLLETVPEYERAPNEGELLFTYDVISITQLVSHIAAPAIVYCLKQKWLQATLFSMIG
jgi:hypothetical protein